MGQRILVSESEKSKILNMHNDFKSKKIISEQIEEQNFKQGIQCFLNKKGITDDSGQKLAVDGSIGNYPKSKTAQAIAKYQDKIGVRPDGVWGTETMDKMSKADKSLFNSCQSEYGDLFDKLYNWLFANNTINNTDTQNIA
jgi:murein L,D-transpeptidase YcbB/YkuD